MNKNNRVLVILLIIIIILLAFLISKPKNNPIDASPISTVAPDEQIVQNIPAIDNWKTYTNAKHGFSFQYPDSWSQWGTGSEAVCDIHTGATCVAMIDYMDTASQAVEFYDGNNKQLGLPKDRLHVEYHFDSRGTMLYQYALSQYQSKQGNYANAKEIQVARRKAIWADNVFTTNGKGNSILPSHVVIVDFLDKDRVGSFEFQFTTPKENNSVEIHNFEQLLKTFKFN